MPGDDLGHANLGYRASDTAATAGGTAALNKLWLPVWSGEVIHAYDESNQFEGLTTHKTIPSGRKMEFPITGTVNLKTAWSAGGRQHVARHRTAPRPKRTCDARQPLCGATTAARRRRPVATPSHRTEGGVPHRR